VKARIIAFSRPVRSDAQPQKTRLAPLAIGLNVAASVTAAAVRPHERAIGARFAVASRNPVAIITNDAYIM